MKMIIPMSITNYINIFQSIHIYIFSEQVFKSRFQQPIQE